MTRYLQVRKQPQREAKGHSFRSPRTHATVSTGTDTFASQVAKGIERVEHFARLYQVQQPEQVSS